jgi:hypothetical protein
VRVPEGAATGIATITVAIPGWNGVTFSNRTYELDITE